MKSNQTKALLMAWGLSGALLLPAYSSVYAESLTASVQQTAVCKGVVKDVLGEPIIGASILVKGTTNGVITDLEGNFSLPNVRHGDVIQISFIGFGTQEVKWNGQPLQIVLQEDSQTLEEVVVTALGIKRSEKALSYNVQQVKSDALTAVKDVSFVNNLNGRVAGVNINASAGAGGASRVVMRGAKSITGNNSALYVIDGVPMVNKSGGDVDGGRYSKQQSGEAISDLNPDDIESVNVLTGPSAAALYGSAAANGVILINTKKGKEGKLSVSFASSMDFSNPLMMPEFQNTYGNVKGSFESWGAKLDTPTSFNPRKFFQTGHNYNNSVTLSTGTQQNQTYVSVAATNAQGILPNNEYDRYNFTVRNTASFLNDRLLLDVSGSYVIQRNQNMYRSGEYYNPLPALYLFPRGESWADVELYKRYDAVRKFPVQYWPYGDQGIQMQNPYFIVNDMMMPTNRKRYMLTASLKYNILDWLNVTGRVRVDNTNTDSESRLHASGTGLLYSGTKGNGIYRTSSSSDQQTYMDVIINANKALNEDFNLTANLGASLEDYHSRSIGFGGPILKVPNLFSAEALDPVDTTPSDNDFRKRSTAIFGSAELGWKNSVYLTLTGRNDWSSLLVNAKEPSFFYPSVGLSTVISNLWEMPKAISFLKVRGSYTEVGSPIPDRYRGITRGTITYPISNGLPSARTVMPFYDFKAERTRSYEFGLNLRMFNNKLNFDLTLYKSNTYNQTFLSELPASAPYSAFYIQAGRIQNHGIELSLGYDDEWGDFSYSTNVVYSRNVNKVKELVRNYPTGDGGTISFNETSAGGGYIREGDAIGDIYVTKVLKRDAMGQIAVDEDGKVSSMELPNGYRLKIGSANPDFTLGWRNTLKYKNLSLSFLINARVGGIVTSGTQAVMDKFGVSKATADARDKGGVVVAGGKIVDPEKYYAVVAGEQLMAYYYYSATNVRLQEATLSYALPTRIGSLTLPKISVSLIGRNLLMIYNKAPFDPEITATTGTYGQGSEYFGTPSLRTLGFGLKVQF